MSEGGYGGRGESLNFILAKLYVDLAYVRSMDLRYMTIAFPFGIQYSQYLKHSHIMSRWINVLVILSGVSCLSKYLRARLGKDVTIRFPLNWEGSVIPDETGAWRHSLQAPNERSYDNWWDKDQKSKCERPSVLIRSKNSHLFSLS